MLELLVELGFLMNYSFLPEQLDDALPEDVRALMDSVPTLQSTCRKVVRKHLSHDIEVDVQTLPLPSRLKDYILLAEVYESMEVYETMDRDHCVSPDPAPVQTFRKPLSATIRDYLYSICILCIYCICSPFYLIYMLYCHVLKPLASTCYYTCHCFYINTDSRRPQYII